MSTPIAPSLALTACLLLAAGTLSAQEPAPRPRAADLAEVFGPDGSIAIPYEELLRLIRGERPTPPVDPGLTRLPAGFVLVGASLKVAARDSVAEVEATLDVDLVGAEDWVVVPVRLGQAALREASVGGKPAVVAPLADLLHLSADAGQRRAQGYGVLLRGKGRQTLVLRGELPLSREAGSASLALDLPAAALARLELSVPGQELNLGGELTQDAPRIASGRIAITAFYAAGERAQARWSVRDATNPTPSAEVRDPLIMVESESVVRVEESVAHTATYLSLRVVQAPASTLRVRIPAGATLVEAQGLGKARLIGRPEPQPEGDAQVVTLRFAQPLFGEGAVIVGIEQSIPEGSQGVAVPRIEALGIERERGLIAIRAARTLELEAKGAEGLSKAQPKSLSEPACERLGWKQGEVDPPLVFQHRGGAWRLGVATRPVEAAVEARLYSLALVREDEIGLATSALLTVRKRPVFSFRFALPPGFTLLHFADPRQIRQHRIQRSESGDVLEVELREPVGANKTVTLSLFGTLRREGAAEQVEIGRLRLLDASKEAGWLAVGARQQLQLAPEGRGQGLWSFDLRELLAGEFPHGAGRGEELLYAYRHAGEPSLVRFKVTKREPRLRANLETLVDAQEDQVRISTTARCEVEFAGLTQVRLRGPAVLAKALVFAREGIASSSVALESEAEGGRAIWTIQLQGKRTGAFTLGWHYAIKLDDFAAGQQKEISLAPLEVLDCFRLGEEIALKKHENLVTSEVARAAVETRDPGEVANGLRQGDLVAAYRVQAWPYRLSLRLTKYDLHSPLGIEIRHLHQDEVVDERGQLNAEAVLSILNKTQQDLQILLPPGARVIGVYLAGRSMEWQDGPAQDGRPLALVHLGQITKERQGAPFRLRIRYEGPLVLPSLSGEIAPVGLAFPLAKRPGQESSAQSQVPIARATRTLYLPQGSAYLSFGGVGSKHFAEEGVWRTLTGFLRELSGQAERPWAAAQAANSAQFAVAELKGGPARAGLYTPLDLPSSRTHTPYLFERLGGNVAPRVRVMAWPLFYLLDLIVLCAVVAGGLFYDKRQLPGAPWAFPLGVIALSLAGGAVGGRALQAFCAAALLAALGLVVVFLGRALWRELTERRAARGAERTEREAQVARARAEAMEAEASLREAGSDGEQEPVGAGAPSGAGGAA